MSLFLRCIKTGYWLVSLYPCILLPVKEFCPQRLRHSAKFLWFILCPQRLCHSAKQASELLFSCPQRLCHSAKPSRWAFHDYSALRGYATVLNHAAELTLEFVCPQWPVWLLEPPPPFFLIDFNMYSNQ